MASRGSVYKRGATWTAHVKFQRGGRWVQSKVGGFPTRRRAEQRLTALLAEIDGGTYVAPSKLTVGAYLDAWLAGRPATGTRASTITGYRRKLNGYVGDDLRALRLGDLTAVHLDALYATLVERVSLHTVLSCTGSSIRRSPMRSGKDCSAATSRRMRHPHWRAQSNPAR